MLQTKEGLDRDRDINIRPVGFSKFYETILIVYKKHSYNPNHIWNFEITGLQVGRNYGMCVISKKGSKNVPKNILNSREWITIMCCVNAICASILWFYLLKG